MIITLTTDFGYRDGFPAVMKGAILSINKDLNIIDISHDVPVFDVASAAWLLANSFSWFPPGTVHIAVVDPGVGTGRRAVAMAGDGHFFVGPDNGIFTGVLARLSSVETVELRPGAYTLKDVSNTFHGRDVFAPVAAHLASGVTLYEIGEPISVDQMVSLELKAPTKAGSELVGQVVYVDKFGNLITNIPADSVQKSDKVFVAAHEVGSFGTAYLHVSAGKTCAIVGSHGYLEVAVCMGNAAASLNANIGTPVVVRSG
jgi:S-adenosyl-L-methionine hydrolase (adenosine-forming)